MSGGLRRPTGAAFGLRFSLAAATDREGIGPNAAAGPPVTHRPGGRGGGDGLIPPTAKAISRHRDALLFAVEAHAVTVVIAPPGSGKTTVLPTLLADAGWAPPGLSIAVALPTPSGAMAAAALAADGPGGGGGGHVGGGHVGGRVGYAIPFEAVLSPPEAAAVPGGGTSIVYYGGDTLLRSALTDPLFTRCGLVVVSLGGSGEPRPLCTDALLGALARVLPRRPDLRLVLTADDAGAALPLARYFGWRSDGGGRGAGGSGLGPSSAATVLALPPLSTHEPYSPSIQVCTAPVPDVVAAAVDAVLALHASDRPGDILVVLPLPGDVDAVAAALQERVGGEEGGRGGGGPGGRAPKRGRAPSLAIARLHGGVGRDEVESALSPSWPTRRAIVTVGGVVDGGRAGFGGVTAVVDSLLAWQRGWDPSTGLDASGVAPISRATAGVRAAYAVGGAAGDRPGVCVRLATADACAALEPRPPPAARGSDLCPTLLLLAALGVGDALAFPWPARPPSSSAARGLETLHALGLVADDGASLTAAGEQAAELPLPDPRWAAALVAAGQTRDPAVIDAVAAALALASVRGIWSRAAAGGSAAGLAAAKARFAAAEGDWVTHLNAWRAWHAAGGPKPSSRSAWAGVNGLDNRALLRAADIAGQVRAHARRVGMAATVDGRAALADPPAGGAKAAAGAVVAALAAGLFVNAAVLVDEAGAPGGAAAYRLVRPLDGGGRGRGGSQPPPRLRLHKASVLAGGAPPLVLFGSAVPDRGGWYGMADVLVVDVGVLRGAAPHYFQGGGV